MACACVKVAADPRAAAGPEAVADVGRYSALGACLTALFLELVAEDLLLSGQTRVFRSGRGPESSPPSSPPSPPRLFRNRLDRKLGARRRYRYPLMA
jgi:hypothetical protein